MTEEMIIKTYGKSIWDMSCSEIVGNGLLPVWSELRKKKTEYKGNNVQKKLILK